VPADRPPRLGTPLRIGWVGAVTSATGTSTTQGKDALDAWVRSTNDAGGINGHPVEAFYADDKGDPAVGLTVVKDLVENKHVIAIVGSNATGTQQTWAPYILEKRIPVVNGPVVDSLWYSNPMFYPMAASNVVNIWGFMKAAKAAGATKVAVVLCTEVAACAQAQGFFKVMAESVGLQQVYTTLSSRTQVSYTAECLAAKNAGADAVASFVNNTVLSRDCGRQDYHPLYINSLLLPEPGVVAISPELERTVGASAQWPCYLAESPGPVKEYLAAMKKYGHGEWNPGGSGFDQVADVPCVAWVGGVAFAKAIQNLGVTADAVVSSEDVIRGLSMFQDETLGGIAPKVTLSDGTKPNPQVQCMWFYRYDGSKRILIDPTGALTCKPA
jgi:branched-chain amino acid transport system substrate-binding protein